MSQREKYKGFTIDLSRKAYGWVASYTNGSLTGETKRWANKVWATKAAKVEIDRLLQEDPGSK